jgi:hypothetical protein
MKQCPCGEGDWEASGAVEISVEAVGGSDADIGLSPAADLRARCQKCSRSFWAMVPVTDFQPAA